MRPPVFLYRLENELRTKCLWWEKPTDRRFSQYVRDLLEGSVFMIDQDQIVKADET